ncbi:MAG: hypothetical protein AB7O49_03235 [Sphingomonadales bacterium]
MIQGLRRMATRLSAVLQGFQQPPEDEKEDVLPIVHRMISFRDMDLRLRAITGLVFAEIIAAVIAIVTSRMDLPTLDVVRPRFEVGTDDGGLLTVHMARDLTVPAVSYAVAYLCAFSGLVLLTVGIVGAHRLGRALVIGVLTLVFLVGVPTFTDSPGDAWLMLFLVFLWCVLAASLPALYRARYSPERRRMWVLILLIVAGIAPIALAFALSPAAFSELLYALRVPLVFVFLLSGTDWAEISDEVLRASTRSIRLERSMPLLFVLNALAALFMGAETMRVAGDGVILSLIPGALAAGALWAILRAARFEGQWPISFPWALLALAVLAYFLPTYFIVFKGHDPWLPLAAAITTVAAGGALVACGRRPRLAWMMAPLLFAVVLGLYFCFIWAPGFGNNLMFSGGFTSNLFFCVFVGTFAALAWAWRRRWQIDVRRPLLLLLLMNLGMLLLQFLDGVVYEWLRGTAESGVLAAAAIVFVAIVWDILMSGDDITNVDGKLFPRRSRVSLFFSYVMLALAIVVFWGSMEGSEEYMINVRSLADSDQLVELGIKVLGPTTLLTLLVLRWGRWAAMAARPAPGPYAGAANAAAA